MKLRITESQLKRLKENLNSIEDERYYKEVNLKIRATNYKGFEVNEISVSKTKISYKIEIEARSWGISEISLFGIRGDSDIQAVVSYYPKGDDPVEETVSIPLDWDRAHIEVRKGQGHVSVDDDIEIELDYVDSGFIIRGFNILVNNF